MVAPYKQKTAIIENPESAYLLGVYYGDGTAFHYTIKDEKYPYERWMFGLSVSDKDFRDKTAAILKKLVVNYISIRTVEGYYRCEVSCKQLYDFLKKPFYEHKQFIEKYFPEFLRGFFDSEGGIYYEKTYKVFRVRAYNTNKQLLDYIIDQLRIKYNIATSIWVNVKKGRKSIITKNEIETTMDCYVIQIVRKKDVEIFMSEVGFSIARKNKVWLENLSSFLQ